MHREAMLRSGANDWSGDVIPGFGPATWWLILAKALLVFVFLVLTVLVAILAERKILGRMQLRWGPNRVGPGGYLQSLADAIKLALKEPIIPFGVEKPIFILAPAISTIPAITAFAFIPFGPQVSVFGHWTPLQVTDLPVAVLFILALSSIGVYGIVLAGWSSGSTYPLLGGVRSTAQVISYEVAMGLSFATVFLFAGTMSTSQIVSAQDRVWYVFLLLPSFTIYLVSMVGETNRAPFDLPEAEGGGRTGRGFPHRVLVAELRHVLSGRVHQHDHGLGPGRDVVHGRLARAVAAEHVGRRQQRLVAGAVVHRQGVAVPLRLLLAAGDAAAAALRPVHGAGVEAFDPGGAGLGADRRGDPHPAKPRLPALDATAGRRQHRRHRRTALFAAKTVQRQANSQEASPQ